MKDARELFRWYGRQRELAEQLWAVLDEDDERVQLNVLLRVLAFFIFQHTENVPLESDPFRGAAGALCHHRFPRQMAHLRLCML